MGTNPCEKLAPKAWSSVAVTWAVLIVQSFFHVFSSVWQGLQASKSRFPESPASLFCLHLANGKHSWGKVYIREKFHPIPTLVLVTAVKVTSD